MKNKSHRDISKRSMFERPERGSLMSNKQELENKYSNKYVHVLFSVDDDFLVVAVMRNDFSNTLKKVVREYLTQANNIDSGDELVSYHRENNSIYVVYKNKDGKLKFEFRIERHKMY